MNEEQLESWHASVGLISPEVIHEILDKLDQMALIVAEDGFILFANAMFLEHFGLTQQQAMKHMIYDERLGITTESLYKDVLEKVRANGGKYTYERTSTYHGKEYHSETTVVSFAIEGVERLIYLSKDISALRESQTEARELNEMLRVIIDNLPVYLFVKDVDDDFRYIIWNKAFAERSKIPASKVIGRTDFEVFPDFRDAQAFRDDDLSVLEKGEMTLKLEAYRAADGTMREVQTYKTIIPRQGRGPLLVGISLDVTDVKGIEEELVRQRLKAEESDRLKTRFLANMSHEIRTPLNAIVGFSTMLPEAEDEHTREQFIGIINENSELLLRLINDILDLSRIEAGTLEYTKAPIDLNDMCRNLLLIYKAKAPEGVKVVYDNEADTTELVINEDRNRLVQVMDNLLNNAVKFTRQGEIHYGYRIEADDIEVYVSDTGIGIPADKREAVFERFVKLDNFVQGTGLGLPICKLIVETLGGEMRLDSEEGKGSRFAFTIPHEPDWEAIEPERGAAHAGMPKCHHGHVGDKPVILVAEDINGNFLVVQTMIKNRYEVVWAHDGDEAVRLAREIKPDLILMDIKMPTMNGLEATREIRRFDKDVPIVALTANAFDEDRREALESGMDNFLPKPINRDTLEAILTAYLK